MMQVYALNFGNYFQKIFMVKRKIIDTECNCKWGKNNQKAWKNGDTICKHTQDAIMHLNLKIKKYGINKRKDRIIT